MKTFLIAFAVIGSGVAIFLAMDLGRLAFNYAEVDGHPVRMLIRGQGNPTVVFETGGGGADGGPLEDWAKVQPAVSKFARTVSYDRAGIGFSAPGPAPRDAREIARELHIALGQAHLAPPYILVGHSFGGPYIRVFAAMYPRDVSGLVLIDPTQEEFTEWNRSHTTNQVKKADQDILASLAEAHESAVPPGIPVVLITALGPRVFPDFVTDEEKQKLKTLRPMWLKFHDEWLEKLPNARHILTQDSGHMVPFEQPELIVGEIRKMVAETERR
jgi:pimeloyl-ACP methyl ester carboxylesterase